MSDQSSFDKSKAAFLRLANTLQAAETPAKARALLLADTEAPYHNFDVLALVSNLENLAGDLAGAICADLDSLYGESN